MQIQRFTEFNDEEARQAGQTLYPALRTIPMISEQFPTGHAFELYWCTEARLSIHTSQVYGTPDLKALLILNPASSSSDAAHPTFVKSVRQQGLDEWIAAVGLDIAADRIAARAWRAERVNEMMAIAGLQLADIDELSTIAVRPDAQRAGLGSALLKHALKVRASLRAV